MAGAQDSLNKALEKAYLIRDTPTQYKACVTGSSSITAAFITHMN